MSKNKLKLWFIPHADNKHQAHLLKFPSLIGLVLVIVLVQVLFNFAVTGRPTVLGFATDINIPSLVQLTNQQRLNSDLPALNINRELTKAAQLKARNMVNKDYWAHNGPDGTTPWTFFNEAGYKYNYAGENLAKDFNTSNGVVSGWMASPEHKANILDQNYTDIGIATINGRINGQDTTMVVAMYGSPQTSFLASTNLIPTASASTKLNAPKDKVDFGLFKPLPLFSSIDVAQLIIILLLSMFIFIYLGDHIIKSRNKFFHRHSHSLLQASILAVAVMLIIVRSFGAVG